MHCFDIKIRLCFRMLEWNCSVLVPDLFRGDPWEKGQKQCLNNGWLAKTLKRVANDIATSTKWMVDEFTAAGISKKLGIIGFCFGGGRVIDVLAADQGACFSIAVALYGTRMDPSAASKVRCLSCSFQETMTPLPGQCFEWVWESIGKGSRVVIFKGRGHAFAHRPGSPKEDADAEQAFILMRNWHLVMVILFISGLHYVYGLSCMFLKVELVQLIMTSASFSVYSLNNRAKPAIHFWVDVYARECT